MHNAAWLLLPDLHNMYRHAAFIVLITAAGSAQYVQAYCIHTVDCCCWICTICTGTLHSYYWLLLPDLHNMYRHTAFILLITGAGSAQYVQAHCIHTVWLLLPDLHNMYRHTAFILLITAAGSAQYVQTRCIHTVDYCCRICTICTGTLHSYCWLLLPDLHNMYRHAAFILLITAAGSAQYVQTHCIHTVDYCCRICTICTDTLHSYCWLLLPDLHNMYRHTAFILLIVAAGSAQYVQAHCIHTVDYCCRICTICTGTLHSYCWLLLPDLHNMYRHTAFILLITAAGSAQYVQTHCIHTVDCCCRICTICTGTLHSYCWLLLPDLHNMYRHTAFILLITAAGSAQYVQTRCIHTVDYCCMICTICTGILHSYCWLLLSDLHNIYRHTAFILLFMLDWERGYRKSAEQKNTEAEDTVVSSYDTVLDST